MVQVGSPAGRPDGVMRPRLQPGRPRGHGRGGRGGPTFREDREVAMTAGIAPRHHAVELVGRPVVVASVDG